jgi:hypothetical protein
VKPETSVAGCAIRYAIALLEKSEHCKSLCDPNTYPQAALEIHILENIPKTF